MTRFYLIACCLVLLLAGACAAEPTRSVEQAVPPTTNPFFSSEAEEPEPLGSTTEAFVTPLATTPEATGPADEGGGENAATAGSTGTPMSAATALPSPTPTVTARRLITVTIFDDTLNENWRLENSRWMTVTRQTEVSHTGNAALEFIPYEDFGRIFFTVSEEATVEYPRPQVAGLSFWLNGGEEGVRPEDLVVTIVGSNDYSYWLPGDYSVQSRMQPVFSETRLAFLGLGRDVPPGEWVRIEVRMNELQFDPPYNHVTGFYLKNDRGVLHPFYIDDIVLIMAEAEKG